MGHLDSHVIFNRALFARQSCRSFQFPFLTITFFSFVEHCHNLVKKFDPCNASKYQ